MCKCTALNLKNEISSFTCFHLRLQVSETRLEVQEYVVAFRMHRTKSTAYNNSLGCMKTENRPLTLVLNSLGDIFYFGSELISLTKIILINVDY
jgi:hypothetical protein